MNNVDDAGCKQPLAGSVFKASLNPDIKFFGRFIPSAQGVLR